MKKIHIRKPDIKGLSVKVRNLKFKDIKEHYKARKERRQKILEERRNSKFAKKMQPVYKMDEPAFIAAAVSAGVRDQFLY